jgi:pimeloyl-ACP methyl ester carboxylesterase
MLPLARGVARATRDTDVAVWLLRYRVRGWNEPALDPVLDARWALAVARGRHPGAPIVLVGHSMGGRVALRLAGDSDVTGVCALAPWIEPGEPTGGGNAEILIAHGARDRTTSAEASAAYAERIGASFLTVAGETHGLLHRPLLWQRLVTTFVLDRIATTRHRQD